MFSRRLGELRVAMISPYGPRWVGGISKFVLALADGLREDGVECYVIVRIGGDGISVSELGGPKLVFLVRALARLLRLRPDVVHAHSHWYTVLPGILFRALHPSSRLVFTFHTPPVVQNRPSMVFMSLLLGFCTAATFVSRDLKNRLAIRRPRAQYITYPAPERQIADGTEGERFRSQFSLNNRSVVTFIGPLVWPLKVEGVRRLIESFAEVADKHPQSVLLIVGDGPLKTELESFGHTLLQNRIIFTGYLGNVAAALSVTQVYAHISLQEGLPLALLNAMGLGKPIVASAVGGIPEVISDGQTGLLVQPEVRDVARALDQLLSDSQLRERLGRAAFEFSRTKLGWRKTLDVVRKCYEART